MTENPDAQDDVIRPLGPRSTPNGAPPIPQADSRPLLKAVMAGVVLLLGLLFVVVLLPRWVADGQRQAEPEAPLAAPIAEQVAPVIDEAAVAALKDEAEILLTRMVSQEGQLKTLHPEFWGAEGWQQYLENMRASNASFLAKNYEAAIGQYRQGLERGEALLVLSDETLQEALSTGTQALEGGDQDTARESFELALRIDPDNLSATTGLARAERLPEVLAAMNKARAADIEGNVEAAIAAYAEALAADPRWQPAVTGLAAARGRLAGYRFDRAMTGGLAALDETDYEAAEAAFNRALAIRQGAAAALDGLERVDQARRLNRISLARVRASAFEQQERWEEALQQYEAALALDATVVFAQEGMLRSRERRDLDTKLTLLIEQPARLFDPSTLEDARHLLSDGETMPAPRGKLDGLLQKLSAYADQAATPINVTFVSDGLTQVTVYRIGRVGSFEQHELALRPGDYTAIGSRNGYRDVRAQFKLRPGRAPEPVVVRCTEPI
jgi:tetratricopeptide (TPR) repeat protein